MRVTKYIKMVAESLIHDLSINWDIEKAIFTPVSKTGRKRTKGV